MFNQNPVFKSESIFFSSSVVILFQLTRRWKLIPFFQSGDRNLEPSKNLWNAVAIYVGGEIKGINPLLKTLFRNIELPENLWTTVAYTGRG